VVDPLLEYGRTHTTPSIERSVLLRMGFSSLEAKPLVLDQDVDRLSGATISSRAPAKAVSSAIEADNAIP